jgi:hypothetical protein
MSKLTKLIQGHTGSAESLNNILKEALLLDRKCQNLELALTIAANEFWVLLFRELKTDTPTPEEIMENYLKEAVEQINHEQNNPH